VVLDAGDLVELPAMPGRRGLMTEREDGSGRLNDRGYVELAPEEDIDHALRRLKKQLDLARLVPELKRRQTAVSPSQARREKSYRARERQRKADRRLARRLGASLPA
jgi:ribosomal protein S21